LNGHGRLISGIAIINESQWFGSLLFDRTRNYWIQIHFRWRTVSFIWGWRALSLGKVLSWICLRRSIDFPIFY
jgi:hypothetical protein